METLPILIIALIVSGAIISSFVVLQLKEAPAQTSIGSKGEPETVYFVCANGASVPEEKLCESVKDLNKEEVEKHNKNIPKTDSAFLCPTGILTLDPSGCLTRLTSPEVAVSISSSYSGGGGGGGGGGSAPLYQCQDGKTIYHSF